MLVGIQAMFGMLFQEARLGKEDELGREAVAWVEGTSVAFFYEKAIVTVGICLRAMS